MHFVESHMLLKEATRPGFSILDSAKVDPLLVSALIYVRNTSIAEAKD